MGKLTMGSEGAPESAPAQPVQTEVNTVTVIEYREVAVPYIVKEYVTVEVPVIVKEVEIREIVKEVVVVQEIVKTVAQTEQVLIEKPIIREVQIPYPVVEIQEVVTTEIPSWLGISLLISVALNVLILLK